MAFKTMILGNRKRISHKPTTKLLIYIPSLKILHNNSFITTKVQLSKSSGKSETFPYDNTSWRSHYLLPNYITP